MKKSISSALHCSSYDFAGKSKFIMFLAMGSLILLSCSKEVSPEQGPALSSPQGLSVQTEALNAYTGLAAGTMWELQQAKAASAKYKHVENAIRDGYVDIAVDVENMGHHYMKAALVDGNFDFREPEILVYNRDESGRTQLVAVEYAVPLNLARPEGFTGAMDQWDGNVGFSLWLLHAWVWEYNPLGVFNATNPNVHLH
jgi:hypothetical protein